MTLQRRKPLRAGKPLARSGRLQSRRVWTTDERGGRRVQRPQRDAAWQRQRERCRDNAGGWCQAGIPDVCERRGAHAHHLRLRGQGGGDELDNLAWLCHACHSYVHAHPMWATGVGLIRPRHATPPWPWTPDSLMTAYEAADRRAEP